MFYRPKIFISRCINGAACRYDGAMIHSKFVERLIPHVDIVRNCPEVAIGLGIPREAIRIIKVGNEKRLVYSNSGTDVTQEMNEFCATYISSLQKQGVHGFILKNRSPSCGLRDVKVYNKVGKAMALEEKTSGYFGKAIMEGFPYFPIENEGRLRNYDIRDHFLTQIYTLAHFDGIVHMNSINPLVKFHSQYKYLLMAYSQEGLKKLGRIVANHEQLTIKECYHLYQQTLRQSLEKQPSVGRKINMLQHVAGYFSKDLSYEEKAYFNRLLALYKERKLPYQVPREVLKSYALHYHQDYLVQQVFFEPYPIHLLELSDSGKGRQ